MVLFLWLAAMIALTDERQYAAMPLSVLPLMTVWLSRLRYVGDTLPEGAAAQGRPRAHVGLPGHREVMLLLELAQRRIGQRAEVSADRLDRQPPLKLLHVGPRRLALEQRCAAQARDGSRSRAGGGSRAGVLRRELALDLGHGP